MLDCVCFRRFDFCRLRFAFSFGGFVVIVVVGHLEVEVIKLVDRQFRNIVVGSLCSIIIWLVETCFLSQAIMFFTGGVEAANVVNRKPGKQCTFCPVALDPDNGLRYLPVSLFFDMWWLWLGRGVWENLFAGQFAEDKVGLEMLCVWCVPVRGMEVTQRSHMDIWSIPCVLGNQFRCGLSWSCCRGRRLWSVKCIVLWLLAWLWRQP